MKQLFPLVLVLLLVVSGCEKSTSGEEATNDTISSTLPFDSENLRVSVVSTAVPSRTNNIYFFNEATGIAITYEGKVYRSTDRGVSWALQYSATVPDQSLHQILFTSQSTGYVVGGNMSCNGAGCVPPGGVVLKTTDGGITWTSIYKAPQSDIVSIAANAGGHLFIAINGAGAGLFRSTDAGTTWQLAESATNSFSALAFNITYGFYTGGGARIVRSNDAGTTWTNKTNVVYNYVNALAFHEATGYYLLGYSRAFKTSNNGDTWAEFQNPITTLQKIDALSINSCLLWGGGHSSGGDFPVQTGAVGQTWDGGKHWLGIEFTGTTPIIASHFYSAQQGYAVAGSTLLKVVVK